MEALLETQQMTGMMPDALKKRPKLKEHDRLYFKAFGELTSSRPQGESFGNIPVSEFLAWCQLWKIEAIPERERIFKYLKRVDDTFVSFSLEQRKKELERMKANSKK